VLFQNVMLCIVCACFSISGGSVLIDNFKESSGSTYHMAMACGAFAIINGIIMTIDMMVDYLLNKEW
jgi:uncharacterized membrane protein HdeD (DUF308 family)